MLRVYNTLSRKVEELRPREEGRVTMYVCGLTPYDFTHVGHARTYVAYDALLRYLRFKGYRVFYVQNFTDIDDKIIARAREGRKSPFEVAEFYSEAYLEDMDKLGVLRADVYPKVTEHIPQIIDAVRALVEKGNAYILDGDVYFDVTSFPGYGKLSGKNLEELVVGARVEPKPGKRHPLDFALWKGTREGEPSWSSPWGQGRPGWHIECSVMSVSYLGMGFDIHGGAIELSFPHHENEIAQSEAWTGKSPFVKHWVHTGLVTIGGEKMSKSLGNIVTVREVLDKYEPDVLRLFFLRAHYRQPIDFTWEGLEEARRALRRLRIALRASCKEAGGPPREGKMLLEGLARAVRETRSKFTEAMDEDLGTPEALGALFSLVHQMNSVVNHPEFVRTLGAKGLLAEAASELSELMTVLGLSPWGAPEAEGAKAGRLSKLTEELLSLIIEVRHKLRERREFDLSDEIRSRLRELGVILEDRREGTGWRLEGR